MSETGISGFYRQSIDDRVKTLVEHGFLDKNDAALLLAGATVLSLGHADRMLENVVGVFGLPLAVAPNFRINDRDYLVPMVVEEPSIVAGVSGAAKSFRRGGGFVVAASEQILAGQVQMHGLADAGKFSRDIDAGKAELIGLANDIQPNLVKRGGGTRDIETHEHLLPNGETIVVVHILVDTCDAMGANAVNTICEAMAPHIQRIAGGQIGLRILSNLADRATVTARGRVPLAALAADAGEAASIRDAIIAADEFARVDPYRATTHNKGIMNGIDAVAIATGNDWRAIEAGAHAYAARDGQYRALTKWSLGENGDLQGELALPLKPGTVGGSLQSNPGARLGLALSGVATARELAQMMCATGLAQNFAALKALVSAGIQAGHMRLHARSVAATAGVPDAYFDAIVAGMIEAGEVKVWKARELFATLQRPNVAAEKDGDVGVGQAAGKVILLGEHAVVYGRRALALPIQNSIYVSVKKRPVGVVLRAPGWNINEQWSGDKNNLRGAAAVVELIIKELGVSATGFELDLDAQIPLGMGLGSSAAFAVATIRAISDLLGIDIADADVNRLAFKCEGITHGTPSGIDNYLATFAQPVLFQKKDELTSQPLNVPDGLPLVVAASGARGNTKTQVDAVRRRYEKNTESYEAIFDNIDAIAASGALALSAGDYDKLGDAMNICHGLLNAIGVSTPELERMVTMAREAGASGAKLTGAGGGGSIVALCPNSVDEVSRTLESAGYQIITMA